MLFKMKMRIQGIWDFLGIPFRFILFDQEWLPVFHWTTLEDERLGKALPYIKGELLDIGSGTNKLVQTYGNGIGVDVFDWGGGTIVVKDTASLGYADGSFDTITFIACLNHIPNREDVVREVWRLLRPNGRAIVTMINPVLGIIGHKLWWYSEDKKRGGMQKGEVGGMWNSNIVDLFNRQGFRLDGIFKFEYGLNNMLIFRKT